MFDSFIVDHGVSHSWINPTVSTNNVENMGHPKPTSLIRSYPVLIRLFPVTPCSL